MTASLQLSAISRAAGDLARLAPDLRNGFLDAIPPAADTVGRRLAGALAREGIITHQGATIPHAFGRVEYPASPAEDPVALLGSHPGAAGARGRALARELTDAVVNLALAYVRREAIETKLRATGAPTAIEALAAAGADEAACRLEQLATEGHNLHPCGRTRLGWQTADVLAHDLEAPATVIGFVAIRRDHHLGDDLAGALAGSFPHLPAPPPGYLLQPVHGWQRDAVIVNRYAELVGNGVLRPMPDEITAHPTAALRTLLLAPGADGRRWYLKVALDIQVTSTRRTISVASTRNGPTLSRVLRSLCEDDPRLARLVLLEEAAGAALPAGSGRDGSAILRAGINDRLEAGEQVVPGVALPAADPIAGTSVLATVVDQYAATRGLRDRAVAAERFIEEHARLLLPPVLLLATGYGIGLEAHLQNCLPTFRGGVPHRLVFRDFAGLRLHPARMAQAGLAVPLWDGSVVATDSVSVLRAKVHYTALQAHLGELVMQLVGSHGLDERRAWRRVRAVVDATYDELRADRSLAPRAAADHAALVGPRLPHKALVRMRLAGRGDLYVPVDNALHDRSQRPTPS